MARRKEVGRMKCWRVIAELPDVDGFVIESVVFPRTCSAAEEALAHADMLREVLPGYRLSITAIGRTELRIKKDAHMRRLQFLNTLRS
jgi:hypothetical protein